MNAAPQQFGVVRSYDDLIEVLRNAVTARGITFQTIDDLAGLQSGYSAKLLASVPTKHLGPMSLGSLLGAIGVQLVAVADDAQMARVAGRHARRKRGMLADSKDEVITIKITRRMLRKRAVNGGKARAAKLSRKRRLRIARKAARTRWVKRRRKGLVPAGSSGEAT